MRGIRRQNFRARRIFTRIVIGADHGDAGKLTLRAGHRRK